MIIHIQVRVEDILTAVDSNQANNKVLSRRKGGEHIHILCVCRGFISPLRPELDSHFWSVCVCVCAFALSQANDYVKSEVPEKVSSKPPRSALDVKWVPATVAAISMRAFSLDAAVSYKMGMPPAMNRDNAWKSSLGPGGVSQTESRAKDKRLQDKAWVTAAAAAAASKDKANATTTRKSKIVPKQSSGGRFPRFPITAVTEQEFCLPKSEFRRLLKPYE